MGSRRAFQPGSDKHVAFWDAVNAYAAAVWKQDVRTSVDRQEAVVRVESALAALMEPDWVKGPGIDVPVGTHALVVAHGRQYFARRVTSPSGDGWYLMGRFFHSSWITHHALFEPFEAPHD